MFYADGEIIPFILFNVLDVVAETNTRSLFKNIDKSAYRFHTLEVELQKCLWVNHGCSWLAFLPMANNPDSMFDTVGPAQQAIDTLPLQNLPDYQNVKAAILQILNLNPEA